MSSTNPPPDLSTAMSTLAVSAPNNPTPNPLRRRLAPHRKYAQKFLTLPDELLTDISGYVTPEDLPNFRLTCKTLANIGAKHFGEKKLAHRRFIFTWYSLKALVDMTAHPVFGPCIKSIMFGDGHVTQDLMKVMDACRSHNIINLTEVMRVLRKYCEHWRRCAKFLRSVDLPRMLETAFQNLAGLGTDVSIGIYSQEPRESDYRRPYRLLGYGSSRDYAGLPFLELTTAPFMTFRQVRSSCRDASFRPKTFIFDLNDQETHHGLQNAFDLMLLYDGRIQSLAGEDICIRQGSIDLRIISSLGLVEFEQRYTTDDDFNLAEHCHIDLDCLGQPMKDALFALPITHFRMESCSMPISEFSWILKAFAATLQVVELVDAVVWAIWDFTDFFPVLRYLRDDLHLHTLVLDDLRVGWKHQDGTGEPVAQGRFWTGHQQIRAGLDVLLGYDGYGWDDDSKVWREAGIEREELRVQSMIYSDHEHSMSYQDFLEWKTELERQLESEKLAYEDWKATRAKVKEAMDRVEAGEFSN